jgi:LPXTG-site transpeptidase (sortase) family protein
MFGNEKNQKEFYDIKVGSEKKRHVFSELANEVKDYPPCSQNTKVNRKRLVRSAFKNLVYRFAYSFVIFAVLFVILNWQSYSQILQVKVNEFRGTPKESSLNELIDEELLETPVVEVNVPQVKGAKTNAKSGAKFFNLAALMEPKTTEPAEPKKLPKLLKVEKNPEKEKQNIPPLEMDIRPPDTRIVIPRINKNVPIVQVRAENLLKRDWNALENDMMEALKFGIVHFPGTALPGEKGNIALTGHSSYFPWDRGRFKDVFALLHEVKMGDMVLLYHKQKKYIYEVNDIKIVKPDDIDVLDPSNEDKLTLITCTPIGTDLRRLIVTAKLIKTS